MDPKLVKLPPHMPERTGVKCEVLDSKTGEPTGEFIEVFSLVKPEGEHGIVVSLRGIWLIQWEDC